VIRLGKFNQPHPPPPLFTFTLSSDVGAFLHEAHECGAHDGAGPIVVLHTAGRGKRFLTSTSSGGVLSKKFRAGDWRLLRGPPQGGWLTSWVIEAVSFPIVGEAGSRGDSASASRDIAGSRGWSYKAMEASAAKS